MRSEKHRKWVDGGGQVLKSLLGHRKKCRVFCERSGKLLDGFKCEEVKRYDLYLPQESSSSVSFCIWQKDGIKLYKSPFHS